MNLNIISPRANNIYTGFLAALALLMSKQDKHTMKPEKLHYFKEVGCRDDDNSKDQDPITTAPGGLGIYRDPLEVLGLYWYIIILFVLFMLLFSWVNYSHNTIRVNQSYYNH